MTKKLMGVFYGITPEEKIYAFLAFDDNTIMCPNINDKFYNRIWLKPRFELASRGERLTLDAPPNYSTRDCGLICCYRFEEDLFNKLKERNMLLYSCDMAYKYDFPDKDGYDKERYHGTPFKRVLRKINH